MTSPPTASEPCADAPALTILGPRQGNRHGSAVIIFPGGAYLHLAGDLEGREVADWFTARGFHAFILSYRLSSNGYLLPVPLIDARRAIQTVRARATDYHINPNRIVVIGFSAGGHLAALAGTQSVPGSPDADDPIDRASSRPDYLVLGYPWLDAITRDTTFLSYCKILNLMGDSRAARAASKSTGATPSAPNTIQFCLSPKTRRRHSSIRPSPTKRSLQQRPSTFIRRY